MAKQKKKSVHLHMNLGTLIFLIIVIYLMAYILSYLGKSKLAIYEVSASDIVDSIDGTGVILRKETLVHTEQSGYINYYVQEGSMVRQNGTVYTVDTTGKVRKYLKQMLEKKNSVSQDEKEQVVEKLKVFSEGYTDNNFSLLYETQNDTVSTLLCIYRYNACCRIKKSLHRNTDRVHILQPHRLKKAWFLFYLMEWKS